MFSKFYKADNFCDFLFAFFWKGIYLKKKRIAAPLEIIIIIFIIIIIINIIIIEQLIEKGEDSNYEPENHWVSEGTFSDIAAHMMEIGFNNQGPVVQSIVRH